MKSYQDRVKEIIREFIERMAKNDITGDTIKTKPATKQYLDNYGNIRWNEQNKNNSDERTSPVSDDLNATNSKTRG